MNANELADKLEKCCLVSWGECTHEDYDTDIWAKMKCASMLRQQQAEIEALRMGFANSGTHDSELAETRAMAGRLFLKVQDLEFERKGYENLTEMLESEKAELTEKNCQQQAEIEALKKEAALQRLSDFTQEADNEPVAWFEQDPDMKSIWYQSDQDNPNAIPLYTHPVKYCPSEDNAAYEKGFIDGMAKMTESAVHCAVKGMALKELTDEEIIEIGLKLRIATTEIEGNWSPVVLEFARAILRKAQDERK